MVVHKNKPIEKKQQEDFFSFENPNSEKNKKNNVKNFFILLLAIFTLLGLAGTYYFFDKYNSLKNDPALVSQKDIDTTLVAVGKLMILPADEVPTVATILDKTKLTGQSFFDSAENGDKLLAFTKTMQAILYRPSTNKIIQVAPIFIKNDVVEQPISTVSQEVTSQTVQEEEILPKSPIRVAYYNGTNITNLSAQTELLVKDKYPNYKTAVITNAYYKNYKQSVVVDLSGQYTQEVIDLADLLSAKVLSLPEGEKKPEADILIISGK
ncbi:MAG: hypothetical protein COY69_00015 [Candidatus Magasanikbacteria bacterium CG_4_10_14_0_8_um_filter_32_14]|uniref:LytR/CpsA/Psr regulator C-terminal domain-containing protein n=1 Tax=Candidatus Magasanikbacteria bacterium CG_4_10_14_0_8_um_filter_32_14 TaxID=1974640 RepID=A0A2M7RB28_9BACT|nr:MAG: hypothetical protein COY69_00015 [Candidatus Magasanikbacteria bacterium CG_4_10_14_0_8_um_filter_32_14]